MDATDTPAPAIEGRPGEGCGTPPASPEAEDLDACRRPSWFIDSDSPRVREYARDAVGSAPDDREKAVRLFYKVRDGIRYDPYAFRVERAAFRASAVADAPSAFCIPKAILLAAGGRALGIPSRLGFGDVRNHLNTRQLRERMGTDLFVFHGWTEFHLDGRWVKATPAFNLSLCERFGVKPLEFDGRTDCLYQPFDVQGRRHMEYVRIRGAYVDLPYEEMVSAFRDAYGGDRWVSGEPPPAPDDPLFNPAD
jgi:transglutaminase-like putative cysteine protease